MVDGRTYETKGPAYRAKHAKRPKGYKPKQRVDGTFKKSKLGKYNAGGRRINGHWFASGMEAARYEQLLGLEKSGRIQRLELQPRFAIIIDNKLICEYVADFRYLAYNTRGTIEGSIIEDVKGMVTPVYELKKKLFEAVHSLKVRELPGQWIKLYEGRTGFECDLIVKEMGDAKLARRKVRLAAKRAAKKLQLEAAV